MTQSIDIYMSQIQIQIQNKFIVHQNTKYKS